MKKGFLEQITESGELQTLIQMRYDGKTIHEIAEHFGVAYGTMWNTIKRIESMKGTEEPQAQAEEIETPYDKLYKNRKRVVELRKQGLYNVEIAKIIGVSDQDVFDFFGKRVQLTSEQIKQIKMLYVNGRAIEDIAENFGASVETIKRICKSVIVNQEEDTSVAEQVTVDLDCISQFYNLIKQIEDKATNIEEDEEKTAKKIQDLLHIVEMEDCDDKKGLEILKEIKQLRLNRRENKDYLALVEPIRTFLNDEDNLKVLKNLVNIVGQVNNKARKAGNRVYFLRTQQE
ncbi:hypothetical protein IJE86_08045 [bacterium]|nr:hypothetical protein [bacterium]